MPSTKSYLDFDGGEASEVMLRYAGTDASVVSTRMAFASIKADSGEMKVEEEKSCGAALHADAILCTF